MRFRYARVATLALVITALFASPRPLKGESPGDSQGESVEVARSDFEVICEEQGELHPLQVTTLASPTSGELGFIVPEGTLVKKGDIVFSLDTHQLEDKLRQLQDELSTAQLNLSQQQQQRQLSQEQMAVDLAFIKDSAELARLRLDELLSHPKPVDKEDAKNQVEQSKVQLDSAEVAYGIAKELTGRGFNSGADLRSKEVAFKIAGVDFKRAKVRTDALLDGALPNDRTRSELLRKSAEIDVTVQELLNKDSTDDSNLQVHMAEHAVEAAERKLTRCKQDLERSVVHAPHEGVVVLRIVNNQTNKKAEVGDRTGPWNSPVDLPNYEKMKVRTQVPESFVQQVLARRTADKAGGVAGSPARVSVKTLPDKVYPAEVIWIDGWARDRNSKLSDADMKAQGMAGVRVFDVEVELLESDTLRLRDGFQATVEFPGESLKDAVSIPIASVIRRDGATYVQIVNDGGVEFKKVELGPTGRRANVPHKSGQRVSDVVVENGLSGGERILVPNEPPQASETAPKKKDPLSKDDKDTAKKLDPAASQPGPPPHSGHSHKGDK